LNIAVVQPSVFPIISQLVLTQKADVCIFYLGDDFSRKGFVHRGKVRNPDGSQWLTLPVEKEEKKKKLYDVEIQISQKTISQIWKSIDLNYKNSVYFDFYSDELISEMEYALSLKKLSEVALYMNRLFLKWLEINQKIYVALTFDDLEHELSNYSDFKIWKEPGSQFFRKPLDNEAEVDVFYPEYRQHFPGFVRECCALDILLEYGPESFRVLDEAVVLTPKS